MVRNRPILVAAVITLLAGLVILVCMAGTLLALRWMPTPTPTNTPRPTWTVSLTPSMTPTLTNTPTPTFTPTPTPTFTQTPTPTSTDTPTPTATTVSTNTPRSRPTTTDTPIPAPTNTPKPALAWTGAILNGFANCGVTRVFGFTRGQDDKLIGGVWIHFWGDGENSEISGWSMSEHYLVFGNDTKWEGDEGNWEGILEKRIPREGKWHVCVVPADKSTTCISNIVDVTTDTNCRHGTQVLWLDFRQN